MYPPFPGACIAVGCFEVLRITQQNYWYFVVQLLRVCMRSQYVLAVQYVFAAQYVLAVQ